MKQGERHSRTAARLHSSCGTGHMYESVEQVPCMKVWNRSHVWKQVTCMKVCNWSNVWNCRTGHMYESVEQVKCMKVWNRSHVWKCGTGHMYESFAIPCIHVSKQRYLSAVGSILSMVVLRSIPGCIHCNTCSEKEAQEYSARIKEGGASGFTPWGCLTSIPAWSMPARGLSADRQIDR